MSKNEKKQPKTFYLSNDIIEALNEHCKNEVYNPSASSVVEVALRKHLSQE